jgi:RNase P subunit RPR2
MEILKRGVSPHEKKYEVTCERCKSELRFLAYEGTVTRDQRDGDYITIQCPVCAHLIHTNLYHT